MKKFLLIIKGSYPVAEKILKEKSFFDFSLHKVCRTDVQVIVQSYQSTLESWLDETPLPPAKQPDGCLLYFAELPSKFQEGEQQ